MATFNNMFIIITICMFTDIIDHFSSKKKMRKLNSFGHCSSEKWAFKVDSRWTGGSKLRKNIWNIRVFITLDNHWSTTVTTSSSSSMSMSTGSRSSSSVTSSPTTSRRKCTRGDNRGRENNRGRGNHWSMENSRGQGKDNNRRGDKRSNRNRGSISININFFITT